MFDSLSLNCFQSYSEVGWLCKVFLLLGPRMLSEGGKLCLYWPMAIPGNFQWLWKREGQVDERLQASDWLARDQSSGETVRRSRQHHAQDVRRCPWSWSLLEITNKSTIGDAFQLTVAFHHISTDLNNFFEKCAANSECDDRILLGISCQKSFNFCPEWIKRILFDS